jgi:hypothetical protein
MAWLIRRRQLGLAAVPEDVPLCELVETYWRLHAVPNLADSTRDFYKRDWANHIKPRLGDYGVRELTPSRLARFREELEHADIGAATVVKCMRIVQSILSLPGPEAPSSQIHAAAGAPGRGLARVVPRIRSA